MKDLRKRKYKVKDLYVAKIEKVTDIKYESICEFSWGHSNVSGLRLICFDKKNNDRKIFTSPSLFDSNIVSKVLETDERGTLYVRKMGHLFATCKFKKSFNMKKLTYEQVLKLENVINENYNKKQNSNSSSTPDIEELDDLSEYY